MLRRAAQVRASAAPTGPGSRWGLERGYEACVEMDADFSHDPAALPELVAPLAEGYEVVIGSRYVPGGSIPNWTWHRHLLSWGGNVYASVVLGLGVADSTAGFRAYAATRAAADRPRPVRAEGYGFQIEMTYRAKQAGAPIARGADPFRRPGGRRVEDVLGHRRRGAGPGDLVGARPAGRTGPARPCQAADRAGCRCRRPERLTGRRAGDGAVRPARASLRSWAA